MMIVSKESLCQKCKNTATYDDPSFIFHPSFNYNPPPLPISITTRNTSLQTVRRDL